MSEDQSNAQNPDSEGMSADLIHEFNEVYAVLLRLSEGDRDRLVSALIPLLSIRVQGGVTNRSGTPVVVGNQVEPEENSDSEGFASFGELFARIDPQSETEKVLVTAYWVQVCQNSENFSAYDLTKELKYLGHPANRISKSLSKLIEARPQLIIQLKKSGSTAQARKTYMLSEAGIREIKVLL